jgi:hypothetical protein
MDSNSRKLAKEWPYPRHLNFEKSLQVAATNWFKSKKYVVDDKYPFILSDWNKWGNNIILPEVVSFIEDIKKEREQKGEGFPLHKFVHHGLSSQALLFNLIGPLIINNDLEPLKVVLKNRGIAWPALSATARFEVEDRSVFNEDSGQPTSIDLVIDNITNQSPLCIECKLVEKEFGGCSVFNSGDCDGQNPSDDFAKCYLHFIKRKYWTLLEKYDFLKTAIGQDTSCILANHYQFFREVLFALEKGGVFVLLSDERSPTFYCKGDTGERGLMNLLLSIIPKGLSSRIGNITIQQLVQEIQKNPKYTWVNEFKIKYAL